MKDIVFCADGTRNSPKDRTNVWKTFSNLTQSEGQIVAYDKGVGTRTGNLLRGAAFGRGLSINVIDGFRFISRHYEPGDKIYLFGFSRGAYTVRSLASWICLCGLPPHDASKHVLDQYWRVYKLNRHAAFHEELEKLPIDGPGRDVEIEALCTWDTVGAIGVQTRRNDVRKKLWHKFHRMTIYEKTRRVYHAVAIDERRTQYYPHLMIGQAQSENSSIEEVWFPGVHSDIGGGFRDDRSLGDLTLEWMISKVREELAFNPSFLPSLKADPLGPIHNTEGGPVFSLFRKANRPIARGSTLHSSVPKRIAGPLRQPHQHREPSGNYSPLALEFASYASPPTFNLKGNYEVVE